MGQIFQIEKSAFLPYERDHSTYETGTRTATARPTPTDSRDNPQRKSSPFLSPAEHLPLNGIDR